MSTYLSLGFRENPKKTSAIFNSLRNIVTEPILNHVMKKYSMVLNFKNL